MLEVISILLLFIYPPIGFTMLLFTVTYKNFIKKLLSARKKRKRNNIIYLPVRTALSNKHLI